MNDRGVVLRCLGWFCAVAIGAGGAGCQREAAPMPVTSRPVEASAPVATAPAAAVHPLVTAARMQIGVTTSYDPAYRTLAYPGGDVPAATGVCADVIVRAFRRQSVDLQKALHEDMAAHFAAYPKKWSLARPDRNIDHRRVLNLMTYFQRQGRGLGLSRDAGDYAAGDVVAWDLGGGLTHIGIVSDRKSAAGTPLIIHNIGRGAQEEDVLFAFTLIGHYRFAGAGAGT